MSEASVQPALVSATPYVGLVPYREQDAGFFFGRDEETRIVAGNLRSSRLTIVYGESGVGKSSLLQAGVIRDLHAQQLANLAAHVERAPFAICSFGAWHDDPVRTLVETIRIAVVQASGGEELPRWLPGEPLIDVLRGWTRRVRTLLVVLDQFEDYFLYHPDEDGEGTFAHEFPRIVNDVNLRVNFVLAIREDAWAKLDRFEDRIPRVFENYLRIEHLGPQAGRKAIVGPVEEWNRRLAPAEQPYTVEPELVDAVIDAATTGGLALADRDLPQTTHAGAIEAPFLQLVMSRIWVATVQAGSHALTRSRLQALGGAQRIVESHLREALASLTASEQAVAADAFRYLVTRTHTKIAHSASDLADWTKRPEPEVTAVLEQLCRGDSGRILRQVHPPAADEPTRYELFHDVLAEPIQEWRRGYDQRRARRRWAAIAGGLLSLVAIVTALGVWALIQRSDAVQAQKSAVRAQKSAASGTLVESATSLVGTRPYQALLLALAANEIKGSAQARSALTLALETARGSSLDGILSYPGCEDGRIAFAPDGKTLAVGCAQGETLLWDVATATTVGIPLENPGCAGVQSVAFAPDGKMLAVGCGSAETVLWDVAAATPVARLLPYPGCDYGEVAFAPAGKMLAVGCGQGETVLWDVPTATAIGRPLSNSHCNDVRSVGVQSVAFAPDGKMLAVGCGDGETVLWDVAPATTVGTALSNVHCDDGVQSVAFAPTGKTLAVGCYHGNNLLWDVATATSAGRPVQLEACDTVNSVAFAPDGKTLAVGCNDGRTLLWNVAAATTVAHTGLSNVHCDSGVQSVAFAPDGKTLAVGCGNGETGLWDVAAATGAATPLPIDATCVQALSVAFAADGKLAVGCSYGLAQRVTRGGALLWDVATRRIVGEPLSNAGCGAVDGVAFAPDGRTLAVRCESGGALLWDVATRRIVGEPRANVDCGAVDAVAFAPDGKTLAVGCLKGMALLWDLATRTTHGKPLAKAACGSFNSLAFAPDGRTLAVGCQHGMTLLWDVAAATPVGRPLSNDYCDIVESVAFSPDGKTLAVGCNDGVTLLWDVATETIVGEPLSNTACGSVLSVAFAPDGQTLAVGCSGGTTLLWDVATQTVVGEPLSNTACDIALSVAFAPDGQTLAVGCYDRTVLLWQAIFSTSIADLKTQVCDLTSRTRVASSLTPTLWRTLAPGVPYTTCTS